MSDDLTDRIRVVPASPRLPLDHATIQAAGRARRRRRRLGQLGGAGAFVVVSIATVVGLGAHSAALPPTSVADEPPPPPCSVPDDEASVDTPCLDPDEPVVIEAPMLDDPTRTVSTADLLGTVVVVHLWGSWCEPCLRDLRTHVDVAAAHLGRDVVFVGVAVDDAPEGARAALDELGTARRIEATAERDGGLLPLGVEVVPTTVVLDRTGHVVGSRVGEVGIDDLRGLIDAALARPG